MKLKALTLRNFASHRTITLDLSAYTTFIFGRNAAGKTSVANAVEYVLTGLCRGVRHKKDVGDLLKTRGADKGVAVMLTTDVNEFARSSGTSTKSLTTFPDLLISAACDPMLLARLDADKRQGLFRDCFAGSGRTVGQVLREACPELAQLDAWEEILGLPASEVEKAEKEAVAGRRAAKRAAEQPAKAPEMPPAKVEIQGRTIDVSQQSVEKVRSKLQTLQKQAQVLASKGTMLSDTPETIEGKLAKAKETHDNAVRKRSAMIEEQRKAQEAYSQAQGEWSQITSKLNVLRDQLKAMKETSSKLRGAAAQPKTKTGEDGRQLCVLATQQCPVECPVDRSQFADRAKEMETEAGKLSQRVRTGQEKLEAANAKREQAQQERDRIIAEKESLAGEIATIEAEAAKLRAQLEEAKEAPNIASQLDDLNSRIDFGQELLAKVAEYRQAAQAQIAHRKGGERAGDEIAAWDELAKAIGGPVKEAVSEAAESACIDAQLAEAWEMDVQISGDGEITANGLPIELLSQSEQWRAGLLVTDMLVRQQELGWIFADGLDILEPATRKPFYDWLARGQEAGYSSIVATGSRDTPPSTQFPSWCRAYWLEHGSLRPL